MQKNKVDSGEKYFQVIEELKKLVTVLIEQNSEKNAVVSYDEMFDQIVKEFEEKGMSVYDVPEHVQKPLGEALSQMVYLSTGNSEYHSAKKYAEILLSIPWNKKADDCFNVNSAIKYIESKLAISFHLRQRLLELFAVRKHCRNRKLRSILLVGPPGVAKTLLATNIAEAMNKKSSTIFLGGESDAHSIKGFLRSYSGSEYGKILKSLIDIKSLNGVIVLDEIDKISKNSTQGSPADALLSVLDETQNHFFIDNYLDVGVDISNILFIATANYLDKIPEALIDRMEVIEIPAYTIAEKINIVENYSIPKRNKDMNVDVVFDNYAIEEIVYDHNTESGVRGLEGSLDEVYRKIITKIHIGEVSTLTPVHVTQNTLQVYYKNKTIPFKNVSKDIILQAGTVNSMAYCSSGQSRTIPIETEILPGSGIIKSSGNVGNQTDESLAVTLTYIRKNHDFMKISKANAYSTDIHVHFTGAIPKNGFSAGVACFISIFSALSGIKIPSNIAATGEITVKGKILPVGRIKEKVTSAYESGIRHIILPKNNECCIDNIDSRVRREVNFLFVENLKEVFVAINRLCENYEFNLKHQKEKVKVLKSIQKSA